MNSLFKTAGGSSLNVSKEALDQTKNLFEDNILDNSETLTLVEEPKIPLIRKKSSTRRKGSASTTKKAKQIQKAEKTEEEKQIVPITPVLKNIIQEKIVCIKSNQTRQPEQEHTSKSIFVETEFGSTKESLHLSAKIRNLKFLQKRKEDRVSLEQMSRFFVRNYSDPRIQFAGQPPESISFETVLDLFYKKNSAISLMKTMQKMYPKTEINKKWTEHHLRMILLRQFALSNSFPSLDLDFLSIELVGQFLEQRVFSELVLCRKSSLKKVLEGDESAARLVVLFVSKVLSNEFLELSDSWYFVKAKLDMALSKLVKTKEIKQGDKLKICGASLVKENNEGVDPLEQRNTYIKVFYNSVRRATWSAVLGHSVFLMFRQNPLYTLPEGGTIPLLKVCVQKRLPELWFAQEKRVYLNKLAIERLNQTVQKTAVPHFYAKVADFGTENSFILVVWRHSEDLYDLFRKGTVLAITQVRMNKNVSFGKQFSTTTASQFDVPKQTPVVSCVRGNKNVVKVDSKLRLLANEGRRKMIDLFGIVFSVQNHHKKDIHTVLFVSSLSTCTVAAISVNENAEIKHFTNETDLRTLPVMVFLENILIENYDEHNDLVNLKTLNVTKISFLTTSFKTIKEIKDDELSDIRETLKTRLGSIHTNFIQKRVELLLNNETQSGGRPVYFVLNTFFEIKNVQSAFFSCKIGNQVTKVDNNTFANLIKAVFSKKHTTFENLAFFLQMDCKCIKRSTHCQKIYGMDVHEIIMYFIKNNNVLIGECEIMSQETKEYTEKLVRLNRLIKETTFRFYLKKLEEKPDLILESFFEINELENILL